MKTWEITFQLRGGGAATYTVLAVNKKMAVRTAKELCKHECGSPAKVLRAVEVKS